MLQYVLKSMKSGQSYTLRAFCGDQEVIMSTVAVVRCTDSYPAVGQIIDSKWVVAEVLDSPRGEYWIRVTHLANSPD